MSFKTIQHFQYVCLLKMLEQLEMFRKCVYFATLKRTDTTIAVALNRLYYNNMYLMSMSPTVNNPVDSCAVNIILQTIYTFTFTVKFAYKEPAYKELMVVKN